MRQKTKKYYYIYFAFKIRRPSHSRHRLVQGGKKTYELKTCLTTLLGVTSLKEGKKHYSNV